MVGSGISGDAGTGERLFVQAYDLIGFSFLKVNGKTSTGRFATLRSGGRCDSYRCVIFRCQDNKVGMGLTLTIIHRIILNDIIVLQCGDRQNVCRIIRILHTDCGIHTDLFRSFYLDAEFRHFLGSIVGSPVLVVPLIQRNVFDHQPVVRIYGTRILLPVLRRVGNGYLTFLFGRDSDEWFK